MIGAEEFDKRITERRASSQQEAHTTERAWRELQALCALTGRKAELWNHANALITEANGESIRIPLDDLVTLLKE